MYFNVSIVFLDIDNYISLFSEPAGVTGGKKTNVCTQNINSRTYAKYKHVHHNVRAGT